MGRVLIVGAGSDIARPLARLYAENGYDLYLAARDTGKLEAFATDLGIRFPEREIDRIEFDVLDFGSHPRILAGLEDEPVGVIVAAGYQGSSAPAEADFAEVQKIIDTNFTGVVGVLNILADRFENRKGGFIVGISSVAGDRGRKKNYIYGAAKSGLSTYLSGLRNRLQKAGVQVLTVKPGFVATRMTASMDLPALLTAQPEQAAASIFNAQQRGRSMVYIGWKWRWIMLVVKSIPEFVFKRLDL